MTEKLENFILNFPSFVRRSHTEKFVILGYFLTNVESKPVFTTTNIMQLYSELDLVQPQNPSDLLSKGPFISTQNGYRLERTAKIDIETQLGTPIRITVTKTLAELPDKLQNYDERQFLKEVINCYSMSAFRAAVVLCWSLSLYHLQQYIIKHRLSDFNKKLSIVVPNARIQNIKSMDDFSEIKESQFIEVCRAANIVSNDIRKILVEKLDLRNSCAHPSSIIIHEPKASAAILDLVDNVVLHYLI